MLGRFGLRLRLLALTASGFLLNSLVRFGALALPPLGRSRRGGRGGRSDRSLARRGAAFGRLIRVNLLLSRRLFTGLKLAPKALACPLHQRMQHGICPCLLSREPLKARDGAVGIPLPMQRDALGCKRARMRREPALKRLELINDPLRRARNRELGDGQIKANLGVEILEVSELAQLSQRLLVIPGHNQGVRLRGVHRPGRLWRDAGLTRTSVGRSRRSKVSNSQLETTLHQRREVRRCKPLHRLALPQRRQESPRSCGAARFAHLTIQAMKRSHAHAARQKPSGDPSQREAHRDADLPASDPRQQ